MKKFKIINQEKIPEKISFIIWDVEGTCGTKDLADPGVIDWIIKLAQNGIISLFITGRDKRWLKSFLISSLKERAGKNFPKIASNLFLRGEVGLIEINNPISEKIQNSPLAKNHPLTKPKIREKVANLFYRTPKLTIYRKGMKIPRGYEVSGDADRNLFLFPKNPPKKITFPDSVWNEYKEIMGSAEIRREKDRTISKKRSKKIILISKKIEKIFKKWGYSDFVGISPTSTSINLPIKLKGKPVDKDWATGKSLLYFSKKLRVSPEEIANRTVAIGDGTVDFLFSTPRIEGKEISIPFIFVGPKSQYKPTPKQKRNVIIKSIPPYFGTKITLEVLEYLKDRFKGLHANHF